jgi:excisionase family DNA binding protein
MIMSSPDNEWITIAEAVEVAGCTDGWLRMLLAKGDLKGWKAGQRAWLLRRSDAVALKNTLTTRSLGKRSQGRSAAKAKKQRKPR